VASTLRRAEGRNAVGSGELVAAVLAGAWRSAPPALCLSAEELAQIAPRLQQTGEGALGWWRVRDSALRTSAAAVELRQAYRYFTIWAAVHEHQVQQAIGALQAAGVEPLLAKGWAIARWYPEPGLRPYEDIDLCVRPEQQAAAHAALRVPPGAPVHPVDVHTEFPDLRERPFDELYRHSEKAAAGDVWVRVLGLEDHLRLLCLHFWRHGAWRPLWLCDIGALLEALPPGFDWDYCLRGSAREARRVVCALGLAHELLGAQIDVACLSMQAAPLPRWLVPAVLRKWGAPAENVLPPLILTLIREPGSLPHSLRHGWPDPIDATVWLAGPFNELPRFPYQLAHFLKRAALVLPRSARVLAREWQRSNRDQTA